MPNIVAELITELARVQMLFDKLEGVARADAQNLLRFGRDQMALNNYEGMQEALVDLREIGKPPAEKK
jgi:hypothetical protein